MVSDLNRVRSNLYLALCLLMVILLAWAQPAYAQAPIAQITSPQEGQSLVGVTTITGVANHPEFQRYRLEFSPFEGQNRGQWFQIAEIQQPVANGPLAQWNTTNVPDGLYQLRLRVILRDGSIQQVIVSQVQVVNTPATPLPTIPPTFTPAPPTPLPTVGPSPTPLIIQPPTRTPAPTLPAVAAPPTDPPTPSEPTDPRSGGQAVLVIQALQNAFCSGVYLAIAGFIVLGIYRFIVSRTRPRMRRMASHRD